MPESFFYHLRTAECSTIASAFNLDLDKFISEKKINKSNELDNKRKALKEIFKSASNIWKYLEAQYLVARETEKSLLNSTLPPQKDTANDESDPVPKKVNIELDPSHIRKLIEAHNKKIAETQDTKTKDALTNTSGSLNPKMDAQQLNEIVKSVRNTSLKPLTYREFSGLPQEDISEHIDNFERIAKINKWDDSDTKVREYTKYLKKRCIRSFSQ